jgi:Peptidase_C39 like family
VTAAEQPPEAARKSRFDRFEVSPFERSWVGPWVHAGGPIGELVASWNVDLPRGTVLEIAVQVRGDGPESGWYSLGRYAAGDAAAGRTTVEGQRDTVAEVVVDTLVTRTPHPTGYRLGLRADASASAMLEPSLLGAMVSEPLENDETEASSPLGTPVALAVPPFSQQLHRGRFPELGGGGAGWCSPTSTAMVLAHWGTGLDGDELASVGEDVLDPEVVHAARGVYDPAYGGTGNWSFNVAYAGSFGLEAFVTRLASLQDAERFLVAGVPLVLSVAVKPGELQGFPLPEGTRGHLLVLCGVTASGDPIVCDPAAPSPDEVRRTYRRGELEPAWLGGSNGTVYVVHPFDVPLPPSRGRW